MAIFRKRFTSGQILIDFDMVAAAISDKMCENFDLILFSLSFDLWSSSLSSSLIFMSKCFSPRISFIAWCFPTTIFIWIFISHNLSLMGSEIFIVFITRAYNTHTNRDRANEAKGVIYNLKMSLNLSHNHLNDHSTERVVARKRCVRRTKMTNNRPEHRHSTSGRESERKKR